MQKLMKHIERLQNEVSSKQETLDQVTAMTDFKVKYKGLDSLRDRFLLAMHYSTTHYLINVTVIQPIKFSNIPPIQSPA